MFNTARLIVENGVSVGVMVLRRLLAFGSPPTAADCRVPEGAFGEVCPELTAILLKSVS